MKSHQMFELGLHQSQSKPFIGSKIMASIDKAAASKATDDEIDRYYWKSPMIRRPQIRAVGCFRPIIEYFQNF